MFVLGGVNSLRNAAAIAPAAEPVTDKVQPLLADVPVPTDTTSLVRINGGVQVAAGAALALGKFPRLASLALFGTLVPTTLAGHRFWEESDPTLRQNQMIHFFKNVSMAGGLLMTAADPDPHKPNVVRRAKHWTGDQVDKISS